MEIVEHDRQTSAWGVDDRRHVRGKQDDTDSSARDTLTIMCAGTALAMLLTAVLLLLSSQIAVGTLTAAFSVILGFAVWLLDTADERHQL